jgi:hypothetical protein
MIADVRRVNVEHQHQHLRQPDHPTTTPVLSFVNASVQSVLQQQGLCVQTGVKSFVFSAISDTFWLQITHVSMKKLKHLMRLQRE